MRITFKPLISRLRIRDELQSKSIDDGTRRLNVPMDAALYRRMKLQALEEDRTMAEITRELWEGYLERNSAEQ